MKKMVIERTFNAPIEKVWEAWTNPEILKQWWAPPGMHNGHFSAEVAEGKQFRYCFAMDEGGVEFWGRGEYQKIEKPHFLSYLDSFTDKDGNDVPPSHYGMPGNEIELGLVEISFKEDGDTTHMTITMDNPYEKEMSDQMEAGWNGMFDNLSKVVG